MADSDRTASLMSAGKLATTNPKAAVTPAAWLNQMAADAGHLHVRRIAELGEVLQEQATSPELAAVAEQLQRVAGALQNLDFSLLEPGGWWARTRGKDRSSCTEFAAQFEQVSQATGSVARLADALRLEQQADAALSQRALVEIEGEYRALEKIIDQGSRWLQDMRTRLKLRQAAAVQVQAQQAVLEDANRCDILVARLKALRALCNAAAQVHEQAGTNAARRMALAETLQQSLACDMEDWQARLATLAGSAKAGKGAALEVQGPLGTHEELQASVAKAVVACEQLLEHEQVLAHRLHALSAQQTPPG